MPGCIAGHTDSGTLGEALESTSKHHPTPVFKKQEKEKESAPPQKRSLNGCGVNGGTACRVWSCPFLMLFQEKTGPFLPAEDLTISLNLEVCLPLGQMQTA